LKKYDQKKKPTEKQNDSADDFIQNKNQDWRKNAKDVSEQSVKIKKEFFENKKHLSEFLPECKEEKKEIPNILGFFETKFGAISVGHNKLKSNSPIAFVLTPKTYKNPRPSNAKRDFENKHNYFGENFRGNKGKFKFSNISWEYDPKVGSLRKINEDFSDGKIENDKKMLYDDENEDLKINNLKKKETKTGVDFKINKSINEFKRIKKEKYEDNNDIKRKIETFIKKLKQNKLKVFEDSENLKIAFKRISKRQSEILYIIRKKIKEMIKSGKAKNLDDALKKINISEENKKYIKNMISVI
jgi:hypothetical protein